MSARRHEVDVLVVGAGPGGAAAAREAARAGAGVLLVERRRRVGAPVRCAEHVPLAAAEVLEPPPGAVARRVARLVTHLPSGAVEVTRAPGYVVHRDRLDRALVRRAVAAGAVVWTGARAVGREGRDVLVALGDGVVRVRAAAVIGADGPASAVARWIGNPPQPRAAGAQAVVRLARPAADAEVFFGPRWPGGYGWLFPKGEVANAGAAVDPGLGTGPREGLEALLALLTARGAVRAGAPVRRTGGWIPVGGPRPRVQGGNVLLVGDAAGHTHPVTGAGIHHALVGGILAGRLAARAAGGDARALGEYAPALAERLGPTLDRALRRRSLYREGCRSGGPDDDLVRRTWVAFGEYYRQGG